MSPSLLKGRNSELRVPTTICPPKQRTSSATLRRRASETWELSRCTMPGKVSSKSDSSCSEEAISGVRTSTLRPSCTALRASERYSSNLPGPVTSKGRCGFFLTGAPEGILVRASIWDSMARLSASRRSRTESLCFLARASCRTARREWRRSRMLAATCSLLILLDGYAALKTSPGEQR